MRKLTIGTLLLMIHFFIMVSAAHALPTIHLFDDQLNINNEVFFESPAGDYESSSYAYNDSSWQGDGFGNVNSTVDGRIERDINGQTEWAENHAYSQFRYNEGGDNSHTFLGNAAVGYYDESEGWPSDLDWGAQAVVEMNWKFNVVGEGATMWAEIDPYGQYVQADFVLYDETEGVIVTELHGLGFQHGSAGDISLFDSHIYSLYGYTTAWGGGDPTSNFRFGFYNADFEVPEPSVLFLLGIGMIGLVGLNRKKFTK